MKSCSPAFGERPVSVVRVQKACVQAGQQSVLRVLPLCRLTVYLSGRQPACTECMQADHRNVLQACNGSPAMHHDQRCSPAAGTLALTRALLPLLRKGVRRTVVNLSSGAGAISAAGGQGGWALRSLAYKASKAALNMGALPVLPCMSGSGVRAVIEGCWICRAHPWPSASLFWRVILRSQEDEGYGVRVSVIAQRWWLGAALACLMINSGSAGHWSNAHIRLRAHVARFGCLSILALAELPELGSADTFVHRSVDRSMLLSCCCCCKMHQGSARFLWHICPAQRRCCLRASCSRRASQWCP